MGDKVRVIIDGKELEVEKGKTILQAARESGIYIPTLCYHERLKPNVSCRICIVEVEGYDKPVTSCNTLVEDGMVIHTNTKKLNDLRKEYLKLILSYHPLDCPICDRGGSCELQDLVFRYGVESSPYEVKPEKRPSGGSVPLIEGWILYWPDRCVLCKRCVSACSEITGNAAIEVKGNGFETYIGFKDESLCRRCGECMVYCPVGALTDVVWERKVRPWEVRRVVTTCPYCGSGCQIELSIFEGSIERVGSKFDLPPNYGNLCIKGRFALDFVESEERLKKPLIKEGSSFREVSWNEALDEAATKLKRILESKGPESVGFIASARCTNEDNYVFQKFVRTVLGSNNIDCCERLCTVPVLFEIFGLGASTNSIDCVDDADLIVVVGSNAAEDHPVIANRIKRAVRMGKGALVVVDPRKTDFSRYASLYVSPKPGTDAFLINGLINLVISKGLVDRDFVENSTEGFDELKEKVSKFTPEFVSSVTGVDRDVLEKFSELYGKSEKAMIFYSSGITQYPGGKATVQALCNLALITGNVGKEGTGINPLMGQCNLQGACDMGAVPDTFPGYFRVEDEDSRKRFESLWGTTLSGKAGMNLTQMLHSKSVSSLYVVGENPVASEPNPEAVSKFLSELDLLIVQDMFLTETAKLAHIVFPSKSFAEKEGTFTSTERMVQRVRKALDPPGEAKDDWWIVCEISKRLGKDLGYTSSGEIFEEIRKAVPFYAGITYSRLEAGGIRWPCFSEDHPGERVLYRSFKEKVSLRFIEPAEPPEEDRSYPFHLITGRVLYHFQTGTMTGRSKAARMFYPEALLEINPEDASSLQVSDGDRVKVVSKTGEIEVRAKVTDRVPKGVLFLPFHFFKESPNRLLGEVVDSETGVPYLKHCQVRVEKA